MALPLITLFHKTFDTYEGVSSFIEEHQSDLFPFFTENYGIPPD